MAAPQFQPPPATLRFGVFEANLSTSELFKHGTRIRIQEQPFEILRVLLERPGETVLRDELRRRLWPDNTFVEYEDSLNTAVRKLRAALSDSSDQPRYVETVARRGYRFIAPISPVSPNSLPSIVVATAPDEEVIAHSLRRSLGWVLAAVVALAAVMTIARPTPTPRLIRIVPLTDSGAIHPNQKLLTDGPRVYFTARKDGRWIQEWMPASGGAAVPIALPFHADLQDISPDGSELLVRQLTDEARGDIWTVSTAGGTPRRLGISGGGAAAYGRDGRTLYYSQGSTVSACELDGTNRRQITTLPGHILGISMPPQGDRLRFYVDQQPKDGVALWESRSDGSYLHRVIEDGARPRWEWGGSWTSDGHWFTFDAPRDSGTDVWLLGEPGRFGRRPFLAPLTSGPIDFVYPIFSRDGNRIFTVGITRRGELTRYDFKKREFTPFLGGISAEDVDFSPDNKWLLYASYPDGRLWRARADGTQPVPLTFPPMMAGWAYWSPDGSKIAFEGRPARGAHWSIYVIPATGGIPEQVVKNTDHGGLAWQSDSKSLIVGSSEEDAPLQVVDLQRHSLTALPGTEGTNYPVLSPSGRYLLARMKNSSALVMFDLVTHRKQQLVAAASDLGYPRWSADGRYLFFNRFLGAAPAFYRLRISDGSTQRLMQLTQFSAAGSWGTWSALSPDGSLLLMRNLGGADLYAIDWSER